MGQFVRVGVVPPDGWREVQVDASLEPRDARLDALGILFRLLVIAAFGVAEVELPRLDGCARVDLVADRHRHKAHPAQPLAERGGIAPVGEVEHFQERRLGTVDAVLRTTLALRDPHRFSGLQHGPHVRRRLPHGVERRSRSADVAVDDERLVESHEVAAKPGTEEIVANCHLGRTVTLEPERVVQ